VETFLGILEKESRSMNRPYVKYITTGMPYVTLKMAQSLDGKIASSTGDSKWITSDASRDYVQSLRSRVDAVVVGANTVLKDDPSLSCRIPGQKQPAKVVISGRSRIPLSAKIFRNTGGPGVFIAAEPNGRVRLSDVLKTLGDMGFSSVLVEGGGEVAASFIKERLVDKFLFFIAPKIIGGRSAITSVEGDGVKAVRDAMRIRDVKVNLVGPDILVEGYA
jgi:diaminohydroxyphosphoribosylaminopyrimidine deaminase/5-amino-6-(5-phosphoribosylamino)uracil reductase